MKNLALLFIVTTNAFSANCIAQNRNSSASDLKIENALVVDDGSANNDLAVVSYKVEERINVTLGSNITTYVVSDKNLINTNNLGGNNVRIVTPKYAKPKVESVFNNEPPKATVTTSKPVKTTNVPSTAAVAVKDRVVNIDIADTYERVLDKGYKSIDMLKSVGNSRFFDGDLVTAAKWYSQLFAMTTDLEAVYYYRYAESLKAIGELEKSKEMMAIFESKNQ
ncbi:MAG TPA: hypothetical protein PKN96_03800 [Flavobacterium sp.]|uniref:hypothetical protein n=1 Tax=Flavobacterium sp. TaxID=239 RepID=UPI002C8C266F|nr:hypothetical protein [Flavobacterium sp.]HNP32390.1 hypothetical protein [Flavobacterium sp.]